MDTTETRMTHLFEQLGLEATAEAIASFILQHQLPADVTLAEAPFWNDAQRALIAEKLGSDDDWAIIVDELNEALHADASAG